MKKRRILGMLLLVLSIIIVGFIIAEIKNDRGKAEAQPTGGNILYVGGTGPNNYTSIQDAIDDASDGDTIFVYNGTYYENIVINKRISLIGQDRNGTIIHAANENVDVVFVSLIM